MSNELNKLDQINDPKDFQLFGATMNADGEVLASGYLPMNKIITSDNIPVGTVVLWFHDELPKKWIWLNGQELEANEYEELYKLLGNRYGGTDSSFRVPNMIGFPFRKNTSNAKLDKLGKIYDGVNLSDNTSNSATSCEFIMYTGVIPVEPDRYEDLPKNKRDFWLYMYVYGYDENRGILNNSITPLDMDSWDSSALDMDKKPNGYFTFNTTKETESPDMKYATYGTRSLIDCDEITIMSNPVNFLSGANATGSQPFLDLRQSVLDGSKMFGSRKTDLRTYVNHWGSYLCRGNNRTVGLFQPNQDHYHMYTDDTKMTEITEGFDLPSTGEILQLLGQLPRYNELNGTGDRWDDIKDFFFADATADPINGGWLNSKNISGIGLTPSGLMQNASPTAKDPNYEFNAPTIINGFGTASCFPSKSTKFSHWYHTSLTMFTLKDSTVYPTQGVLINTEHASAWGGQVRLSRIKTAEELGYRLIVDELNDKVEFKDKDYQIQNNTIVDIPEKTLISYNDGDVVYWSTLRMNWFSDTSAIDKKYISKVEVYCGPQYGNPQNTKFTLSIIKKSDKSIVKIFDCNTSNDDPGADKLRTYNINYQLQEGETLAFGNVGDNVKFGINLTKPSAGNGFSWISDSDPNNAMINVYTSKSLRYKELPVGLERGIVLRYANREKKVVLRKWSQIRQEAEQIKEKYIL